MTMFLITWPGRHEAAVCNERTGSHAADRVAATTGLRELGQPRVREVAPGAVLSFHPLPQGYVPRTAASVLVQEHRGISSLAPDPRFAQASTAWFDFQERVAALLERYPVLSELVPPVVRAAWDAGQASIFDLLVEVGERVEGVLDGAARGGSEAPPVREAQGG